MKTIRNNVSKCFKNIINTVKKINKNYDEIGSFYRPVPPVLYCDRSNYWLMY